MFIMKYDIILFITILKQFYKITKILQYMKILSKN